MSKFDVINKYLKERFEKINSYFDKKNNMYVFLWYGFVVGKYNKDLFDKYNKWFIIKQIERFILRIKILYSTNAREAKNLK